ncbi:MAG TPA: hypothetical protein VFM02_03530 [Candidatus Paceibacterota bacterium]|nr:hypothetical protein [Candidatus Paceibacterota bacterium]
MNTILFFHIIVALLSLVSTALLYVRPSVKKMRVSEILVALTVASGTYLILGMNGQILGTCLMGLAYIAVTLFGIVAARKKMLAAEVR